VSNGERSCESGIAEARRLCNACVARSRRPFAALCRRASTANPTSVCWRERPLTGNFRGNRERPELAGQRHTPRRSRCPEPRRSSRSSPRRNGP